MISKEAITFSESSTFRRARVAWPFLLALVAVGIITEKPWLLFPSLALYAIVTVYVLAWLGLALSTLPLAIWRQIRVCFVCLAFFQQLYPLW